VRRVTGRSLADFFRAEVADPLGLATLAPAHALARMYAAAVGPVDGKRLLRAPAPLRALGVELAAPLGPPTVLGRATATEIAFAIPGARVGAAVIADGGDAQDAVVRAVLECLYSLDA
jgi:CubicO group peptidase (beta-lactamase class C family)